MTIDRFYPIVPDLAWLKRILPLGIKTVQLRIKDENEEAVCSQIKQAIAITNETDCQLIINDFWQLAIECGADYIHLGQEDLAKADLSAIKSAGLKLGISSHDKAELQIAIEAEPEYIALGPIFETKLKKMKWHPQGRERIGVWKARINCPLVAIGGLTVENAQSIFEAGADSLAVVTDIVTHTDPEARIKAWLKATR